MGRKGGEGRNGQQSGKEREKEDANEVKRGRKRKENKGIRKKR